MHLETLVIATRNPGKVAELRTLLTGVVPAVLGLDEAGAGELDPDETGRTFLANATTKAVTYARATGHPCLADDSGLMVDALGGKPGVDSSWFAFDSERSAKAHPREERDGRNNQELLAALAGVPFDRRNARFVCTMVLAAPDGSVLATSNGALEGRIGLSASESHGEPTRTVPRGEGGFGYDPLFLVGPGHSQTGAELTSREKNALSHRGHAVRAMIDLLRSGGD